MVNIRGTPQEIKNQILRPTKVRFGAAKCKDPTLRMRKAGEKLRVYQRQRSFRYERYFDFDLNRSRPNYQVPTCGYSIRITDLKGNTIRQNPYALSKPHARVRYVRVNYEEQRRQAFEMLDLVFDMLRAHKNKVEKGGPAPVIPNYRIPCRFREDFQAGNFSRFLDIWLILIGKKKFLVNM